MSKNELYSFLHPARRRVRTSVQSESLVQSEFAKEANINYLVEKHVRSGIPFPEGDMSQFSDVSTLPDFQASADTVIKAQESWMSLDAKIRRHFGDKIDLFLDALHDPARHDELVRLKVFKPKPVRQATPSEDVPAAKTSKKASQGPKGGITEGEGGA